MREQSLFEETTEISICKDEKQKQKNPDGVLRLQQNTRQRRLATDL